MLGTRSRETKPVSRSLLRDLAADLGTKWWELGKILGLAKSLLNYFDDEYLSLSDKGNAMLGEWKRLNGDDATMEVLQEALTKIDMGHLMENVAGTSLRCWKIKQTHKISLDSKTLSTRVKRACPAQLIAVAPQLTMKLGPRSVRGYDHQAGRNRKCKYKREYLSNNSLLKKQNT